MNRRVLLVILDGWGLAPSSKGNAVSMARTPNFDMLWSKYPHTSLAASGEAVGLPEGQIGNSEVGHLNIGAGRVVWQDLPRISNAVKDGSFFENKVFLEAFDYAKKNKKKVHLLGLVSPGGVHSHQDHLYALLEMAKHQGVHQIFVHAITDGRDTPPGSAITFIEKLEREMKHVGVGKIATLMGRYYAMDRDNRWNRTELAYNALVLGKGEKFENATSAISKAYKRNITDEFFRPSIIEQDGIIEDDDVVIFFNFRSDRPRELTKALVLPHFQSFKREKFLKNLYFVTMSEYEKDLPVKVAFPLEVVESTLDDVLSDSNLTQFHIAETEKYAHVTYFFDGGKEQAVAGEERELVHSPKVATYDLQPEMSAPIITSHLLQKIGKYNFIVVNFANLDMVGHSGKIPQTIKAVETVDNCLGQVVEAALAADYQIIVTADHGNAEKMLNADGTPCTAHSTNKVPFILVSKDQHQLCGRISQPGLSNIAPTIIKLLNIKKPAEMKAKALI